RTWTAPNEPVASDGIGKYHQEPPVTSVSARWSRNEFPPMPSATNAYPLLRFRSTCPNGVFSAPACKPAGAYAIVNFLNGAPNTMNGGDPPGTTVPETG